MIGSTTKPNKITPVRPYLEVGSPRKATLIAMICYDMICYAALCYDMLCHPMLSYAMSCCAVLCSAMLCYAMLCCDKISNAKLRDTWGTSGRMPGEPPRASPNARSFKLSYAMLSCAMRCYAMLCYAALCYAMLDYAILCYVMLMQRCAMLS
eukprot:1325989-Pyramimonas_sp.AAC.1